MERAMAGGEARVVRPDRSQLRWDMIDFESLLPGDHRARMVWAFVEQMDLDGFYAAIGSREGEAGRPAADPAVVLALWLYATVEGVGSARELERLVDRDVAYRWLAGGVAVNYHGLADFRVGHGDLIDRLLSESVAALLAEGLVDLDEVMADGTKIAASAGKGSFGGEQRIARMERQAQERIARLKREVEADPGASMRRQKAAQERAARNIAERAAKARQALERLRKEKEARAKTHAKEEAGKNDPKVSLTDPEARRMRFADGAVRAAYNIQIAAASNGLVLAVQASDRRNDAGLALPMVEDIEQRYGLLPKRLLIDSKYATEEDILALAGQPRGTVLVYTPPPGEKDDVKPDTLRRRLAKRAREPEALKDWRARMAMPEGQRIYARRRRIELVNAHMKNRGFGRINLRGLAKVKIIALLQALAHNILLACHLRTSPA
jgi:transposase